MNEIPDDACGRHTDAPDEPVAQSSAIEPGLPFDALPSRLASSVGALFFAAVVGVAFSLRRVLRVDPAAAIGGAQ